jgi:uncharacterized protein (TIGR02145 family)
MKNIFYFITILFFLISGCSKDETESIDDFSKNSGTFIDERDGHEYKWIRIGEQIWMAENLAFGGWVYDNNISNESIYGRLYSWELASSICPVGWHLPSNQEWKKLVTYIDNLKNPFEDNGESIGVGKYLKSTGNIDERTGLWKKYYNEETEHVEGLDSFGFSGHPGGMRTIQEEGNMFKYLEERGYWWTSTEETKGGAWSWRLSYFSENIENRTLYKDYLMSVRCIKD